MAYKQIVLKRGKSESLKRFHPWIFSGAIAHADAQEGEIVNVVSAEGQFLAVGHYQPGSIAVRVLSFEPTLIDAAFWRTRLIEAYSVRRALGLTSRPDHTIYRLVHGEGDRLPGLIIDIYGHIAVIQAHSVGMHEARHAIAEALLDVMHDTLSCIYYKSETTLPYKANVGAENGFLIGHTEENVALENGLKFHIDWHRGQKTGFFVDQRENRALLERYSSHRHVLNLFCYTGGFSVYALRGGAERVHSVDSSNKAIDLTLANVTLNYPDMPAERHQATAVDAFKFLDHMDSEAYDLIVLDPPAFAKHKDALHNALKGYTRLNVAALRKIRHGGILFTFSCSQAVSKEQFRLAVFTACAQAGRHVRILHQLHQPADHPINIYHPEGEYLKGLVLEVE